MFSFRVSDMVSRRMTGVNDSDPYRNVNPRPEHDDVERTEVGYVWTNMDPDKKSDTSVSMIELIVYAAKQGAKLPLPAPQEG